MWHAAALTIGNIKRMAAANLLRLFAVVIAVFRPLFTKYGHFEKMLVFYKN